jgi:hypothetical protein
MISLLPGAQVSGFLGDSITSRVCISSRFGCAEAVAFGIFAQGIACRICACSASAKVRAFSGQLARFSTVMHGLVIFLAARRPKYSHQVIALKGRLEITYSMLLSLSISTNTNSTFPDQIETKARRIEKLLKRDVKRRCLKQLENKEAGAWKNMQAHGGETPALAQRHRQTRKNLADQHESLIWPTLASH